MHALAKGGRQPDGVYSCCDFPVRSPVDACKEGYDFGRKPILIRLYAVGQIEQRFFSARHRQFPATPENSSRTRSKQAGKRFQQRRFSGTVRAYDAEHLPWNNREGNVRNSSLVIVVLGKMGDAQHVRRISVACGTRDYHRSTPSAHSCALVRTASSRASRSSGGFTCRNDNSNVMS